MIKLSSCRFEETKAQMHFDRDGKTHNLKLALNDNPLASIVDLKSRLIYRHAACRQISPVRSSD